MHTPGPWHLINDVCVGGPISPGWEEAGSGIAHCGMRARAPTEAAANARLIAAAPDLYAALAECADQLWHLAKDPATNPWVLQAKAALAKARGEKPH